MKILVINAGSSSLKFQLIDMDDESVKAKGLVERIGIEGTHFKQTVLGTDKVIEFTRNMKDHTEAISAGGYADQAERCGVRHGFPSDHAEEGVPLWRAV